jgi:Flp pilus assembly protein protease CpaA
MSASATLSYWVLVATAVALFWVAITDLREFKIRNDVVGVLAGLFFLHAILSGRWVEIHWNIGLAILMLAVMLYFYAQKLMGGGDVKLLVVCFLWTGPWCALPFALLMLIIVGLHTAAARLGWVTVQEKDGRKRIPLAPSIAGALIGTIMSGCIRPMT